MEIQVSSELNKVIPHFKVGVIYYKNITVSESPQMLKGRLRLFQESLYFDLEDKNVTDLEGIKEWRQIFKTTGKDPNRYRPSVEALYRRIKKQNFIDSVQSAIDVNNFFSLQYQIPIGVYDTNKINGDITIRVGNPSEEYVGLNGRSNSVENLIVSADGIGAFGSPFVDSDRTPVTKDTNSAVQIIYLRPSLNIEDSRKLTKSLMDMFLSIHGGEGTLELLQ
ncbi:MAG TPA: phenylalanine--tRNA ligase beta subunit-related protein [Pseudoneobacillus sp.]|nr:phenylalanine--tRNA ligase beta subunit-related protein [Pseudoneobacillus sp.]